MNIDPCLSLLEKYGEKTLVVEVRGWIKALERTDDLAELDALVPRMLGKKSLLLQLLRQVGSMPAQKRKELGRALQDLRLELTGRMRDCRGNLREKARYRELTAQAEDATLPSESRPLGRRHPVSTVMEECSTILQGMGFAAHVGGCRVRDEDNFQALNFTPEHPARDMHATFYLKDGRLLRTHNTVNDIFALRQHPPPLRTFSMGRVFRRDDDATHAPMFHHIDIAYVDKGLSFGSLRWLIDTFLTGLFRKKVTVRLRASYFPFTCPSAEVDILWENRHGKEEWLEILGCGLLHPNVLRHCHINPTVYTGIALGAGLERLAMLKYGFRDLRPLFEGSLAFSRHFGLLPL